MRRRLRPPRLPARRAARHAARCRSARPARTSSSSSATPRGRGAAAPPRGARASAPLPSERRGRHVVYLKGHEEIAGAPPAGRCEPRRPRARDPAGGPRRPDPPQPAPQRGGGEPRRGRCGPPSGSSPPSRGSRPRAPARAWRWASARRPRTRRRMPDADLDTLAAALGVSRSAVEPPTPAARGARQPTRTRLMRRPAGDRRQLEDEPGLPRRRGRPRRGPSASPPSWRRRSTTVVCPPAIWLDLDRAARCTGTPVARRRPDDALAEEHGAFTGETSPLMLAGHRRRT